VPVGQARRDPLTGRWTVLAPGRSTRPDDVTVAPEGDAPATGRGGCPFCPGNEHLTPPEVVRTGPGLPGEPGWRTRVVPNRYPIVGGHARPAGPVTDPLRQERPGTGAHEVLVLSPDHTRSLARLDPDQVVEVLTVMRERVRAHVEAGHAFSQAIVNHGAAGGASLAHPHAQVVAADLTAPEIDAELARVAPDGHCLVCAERERRHRDATMVVGSTDADLWCPWWSASAYEMLLAPRRHRASFEDADRELAGVAGVLREGLARLGRALDDPPYNLAVHTRPPGVTADFHWHIHVWPRLQRDGGFERGTGVSVNVTDPVDAALHLRDV
jgi:UDPglucose--hexose-1-phosphate uridylyltransferase